MQLLRSGLPNLASNSSYNQNHKAAASRVPRWLSLVDACPAESVALVDSSKRQRPRVQIPSGAPTIVRQHWRPASSGQPGPATQASDPSDSERSSPPAPCSSIAYPSPSSPSPRTSAQTATTSHSYPCSECSTGYSDPARRAPRSFP